MVWFEGVVWPDAGMSAKVRLPDEPNTAKYPYMTDVWFMGSLNMTARRPDASYVAEDTVGGMSSGPSTDTGIVAAAMGLPAISCVAASPACMAEGIPPSVSKCVALRWNDMVPLRWAEMVWLAEVGRSI